MKKQKGLLVAVLSLVLISGIIGYTIRELNPAYAIATEELVEGFQIALSAEKEGAIGDKIHVNSAINYYRWSEKVQLKFKSTTSSNTFEVYLKDTTVSKAQDYFIIPETAVVGETYELRSVVLYGNGGKGYEYYTDKNYAENQDSTGKVTYIDTNNQKYITIKAKESSENETGKLNSFTLVTSSATLNDKVYVNLNYEGYVDIINVTLKNTKTDEKITRHINYYWESNPYIELNGYINPTEGTYRVDNVQVCAKNDCITYLNELTHNIETEGGMQRKFLGFGQDQINISIEASDTINLKAVNLNTYEATVGDKVMVDVNADKNIFSALLVFYDKENNNSFSAYVKNLSGHAYFMLPSTTEAGKYRLQTVIIKDASGHSASFTVPEFEGKIYTDDKGIFYETIELTVKEDTQNNKESIVFNMEDYNDLVSKKIDTLSDTAVITVICDNYPIVQGTLFKQIAETRKTLVLKYGDSEWIFNGTDIVSAKPIDVSMLLKNIKDSDFSNSNISDKVSEDDISVLSFSNNGTLPGKALIRLNSTELDSKFANKDIFVYYYNEKESSLMKVALEVQKIEGYYEFYINHNSEYILSTKKLDNNIVSSDESMLNLNEEQEIEQDNNTKLYILIGGLSLLIIILSIVIIKKQKK